MENKNPYSTHPYYNKLQSIAIIKLLLKIFHFTILSSLYACNIYLLNILFVKGYNSYDDERCHEVCKHWMGIVSGVDGGTYIEHPIARRHSDES